MIESISPPRPAAGGSMPGFEAVPDGQGRMVGPFAMLATIGPVQLPPGFSPDADARPHPHIGMGVLAFITQGEVTHRDSLGNDRRQRSGEASWMVAGRGVVHSERFETLRRDGGIAEGLVAFVALPDHAENALPSWDHVPAAAIPVISRGGAQGRLLLGHSHGLSAIQPPCPAYLIHWTLEPGAVLRCEPDQPERALLIVAGAVDGPTGRYEAGSTLTLMSGEPVEFRSATAATVVEFGGEPVGPRYRWWNFVASRVEQIEAAKKLWLRPDRPLPPGEQEYAPLPEDHERPLLLLQAGASLTSRPSRHAA